MTLRISDSVEKLTEKQKITENYGESYDLIIIGGGPSGLGSALYGVRAGMKVVLFEQAILGGMVNSIYELENYLGFYPLKKGSELVNLMVEQIKNYGIEVVFSFVNKVNLNGSRKLVFTSEGKSYSANSVIIASGAQFKKLDVEGEEKLLGRGISYCAFCDAPFYKGKKVAVIGGGDAAVEEAIYLSNFAKSVYIIHRREELKATKIILKEAFQRDNIHFLWNSEVRAFRGDKHLEEIEIFKNKENKIELVPFDGAFVHIGIVPALGFIEEEIKKDSDGFILTDENMQTSIPGVFAVGDVRSKKLKQVITAVADGAIAGISAYNYIKSLQ